MSRPLLDSLFIKRFCLPFDSDLSNYEIGEIKINKCMCSTHNHVSVFYKGNGPLDNAHVLSIGINSIGDNIGKIPGIHAELDGFNKLKPLLNRKKRLQNVNMLVIRLSKNNKLLHSKPCANCITKLQTLPEQKGYKIKNIYYSNNDEELVKSKLSHLEKDDLHHTNFYRNQKINNI
jgi:hypothetical protein